MRHHGVKSQGVDQDVGMLRACEDDDLNVSCSDALQYLTSQPDASVAVISAFHVVEHLPFDTLRAWLDQARRVLVQGGLIILETPNPENIQVGICNFYLDPTHRQPIPPALLAFAVQHHGFELDCTLRLQEDTRVNTPYHQVSLEQVLSGASPDYAVLGRKPGAVHLKNPSTAPVGIDSLGLARRWQAQQEAQQQRRQRRQHRQEDRLHQQEQRLHQQEQRVHQQELHQQQLSLGIQGLAEQHAQVARDLQTVLAQMSHEAEQLRQQLLAMNGSTSWRLTAPIRWLGEQRRRLQEDGAYTRSKAAVLKMLRMIYRLMPNYPLLKNALRQLANAAGLLPPTPYVEPILANVVKPLAHTPEQDAPAQMKQRFKKASERQIYEELLQAIQAGKDKA